MKTSHYHELLALTFGGKCIASRTLPDYPIARIRTGQFTPDDGHAWVTEFAVSAVDDEHSQ